MAKLRTSDFDPEQTSEPDASAWSYGTKAELRDIRTGAVRPLSWQAFHDLARRKECRIEEGHLMPDHVHMLISIPPKYSVAQIIGYMKGKSSIWIAQNVERKMRNFLGHKFWARGYFVTTVGRDEEVIRAYIRNQELADQQLEQLELKISAAQKSNQSS